jgi:hypothetical protein
MKLFKYEGYTVVVEPEALLLKPFKCIWNRDKTKNKSRATTELSYIYFFSDTKSDFQYLTDDTERSTAIKESLGLPENWEPDPKVIAAIEFYNKFKSSAALLLEDIRYAIDKLRRLLRDINLEERDEKGKPIYTLNIITSTIKQVPSLVKDLDEAERMLAKETLDNGRMRGQGEKTIMEDGLNL